MSRALRVILCGCSFWAATVPARAATPPTVVIFMIDGLQPQPAQVAAANGATNLKFFIDHGVWVTEAHCTSPAPYARMPDGSLPWGNDVLLRGNRSELRSNG